MTRSSTSPENNDSSESPTHSNRRRRSVSEAVLAAEVNTQASPIPPPLPPMPQKREPPTLPSTLVTGGCGFLGRNLINYILERHPNAQIAVIDRDPPCPEKMVGNVVFYQADLNERLKLRSILEEVRPQLIFHIAGILPSPKIKDKATYMLNNVDATRVFIEECLTTLVDMVDFKGLVHTGSTDAIKGQRELAGVDERTPYPKIFFDHYSESKAATEKLVLSANRPEFPTCSLRPHSIIGADGHILPMMHQVTLNGEPGLVQIGDNKNLYDVVDIENYCAAQLLAAYNFLTVPVLPGTIGCQDLNYNYANQGHGDKHGNPISVAGHSFFITNLEPVYFWTWIRIIWSYIALDVDESTLHDEQELLKTAMPKEGRMVPPPDEHYAMLNGSTTSLTRTHHRWELPSHSRQSSRNRFSTLSSPPMSGNSRSNQPFSFSPTTPLPEPYKPYSPSPPQFPKGSAVPMEPSIKLPVSAGLFIGLVAEFVSTTLRHKEPGFTRNRVKECCYSRWFRGDKAGHVLGYWGGLAKDSMGYDMGGVGVWWGTKRAVVYYLKALRESKQKNVSAVSEPRGLGFELEGHRRWRAST